VRRTGTADMYLWFQFGVTRPGDAYLVVRRLLGWFRVIGRYFVGLPGRLERDAVNAKGPGTWWLGRSTRTIT
jgi:hypothetical protein